jgi:glycosyltransferase involved in cell wall biosynthesis
MSPLDFSRNSSLRILHMLPALRSGGDAQVVYNYYSHFKGNNVAFDFIVHVPECGMLEKRFLERGSRVYHLPRFNRIVHNFFAVRKIVKQGGYRIVHAHFTSKSFVHLLAAWSCGVRIRIAHSHDAFILHGFTKMRARFFGWLTTLLSTRQFACSDMAGRYVFGVKTHSSTYQLLPNAIEIDRFAFDPTLRRGFRAQLGLSDDAFVLLNVGRFAGQKNHSRLIRIFQEVLKIRPEARLLLVGKGELQEETRRQVVNAGLCSSVVFVGESPDVSKYLQAADVFVLPSLHEGLGMVLIEAQAAGLPCFASKDVVPSAANVTGLVSFISLQESDARWASAICSADLSSRENKVSRIRDAGYDITVAAPRLEEWYLAGCPPHLSCPEENHA